MITLYTILFTVGIVFIASIAMIVADNLLQRANRRDVAEMNRQVVKYDTDLGGWLVLINMKKRVVGLYHNKYAVSHARIRLGRSVFDAYESGISQLTIGDFREIDVEIPRFSYRVLYEYKVPHETPVMLYSS